MSPTPPPPTDLGSLAAALGIDPAMLPAPSAAARGSSVFMGAPQIVQQGKDAPGPWLPGRAPRIPGPFLVDGPEEIVDVEDAKLRILNWTPAQYEDFVKRMVAAGLLDESPERAEVEAAWEALVAKAANHYAAGRKVTPFDMVDLYANATPGKASPARVINRSISLTGNDAARSLLDAALSADLGRRATGKEVDDFQAELNSAQRRNPTVTTAATAADGITTTSTTAGGVNEAGRADRYGEDRDLDSEYGSYQAATTYASALFEALRSPV